MDLVAAIVGGRKFAGPIRLRGMSAHNAASMRTERPKWGRFANVGFRRQSKRSCLSASSIDTAPHGVRALSVLPIQTDRLFDKARRILHELRCL